MLCCAYNWCWCVQVPMVRPQLHGCPLRHHGPVRLRPSRGRLHLAGRLQVSEIRVLTVRTCESHLVVNLFVLFLFTLAITILKTSISPLSQRSDRHADRQTDSITAYHLLCRSNEHCTIWVQVVITQLCCCCCRRIRTNAFETVPLDDPDVVFVVANSGIRHRNASGAYGERVQQCKDAVVAVSQTRLYPNAVLGISAGIFFCFFVSVQQRVLTP